MEKGDAGSVFVLILVLALAVVLVDERWLRVAVVFVPALLLAQRALEAAGAQRFNPRVGQPDRRLDGDMRDAVDELLRHIREFYLTCHLMGSGGMSPKDAATRAGALEKDLNRLLARITDRARSGPSRSP